MLSFSPASPPLFSWESGFLKLCLEPKFRFFGSAEGTQMRAKLNLFKTSRASRVADKRHIPEPCGRSECGGRQQRQRWCFCRDANPSVPAPAPPNQGQGYCPHRNKTPSQIFPWPGQTFVVHSKEDSQQWSTTLGGWWGFTEVQHRGGWVEAGVGLGKACLALGVTRPQRRAQENEEPLILLRFSVHACCRVNRRQWEGFLLALSTVTFAHHFFPCPSEAALGHGREAHPVEQGWAEETV